jgi:hypothetical protein
VAVLAEVAQVLVVLTAVAEQAELRKAGQLFRLVARVALEGLP